MALSRTQRRRTLTGLTALPVAALLLLLNPLQAVAAPAGNNGTLKVDKTPFDRHPDNESHVGCSFQVDFYGFDKGTATVTFETQAPTGKGGQSLLTDTVNWDTDKRGGSEDGLNFEKTYGLADALADYTDTENPKQGFHVKLTINAPGAQGADTKHKVFWVKDCETTRGTNGENTPPDNTKITPAADTTKPGTSDNPASTPAVENNNVLGGNLTNNPPAVTQPGTTVQGNNLAQTDGTAPASNLATTGAPIGMSLLLAAITLTLGSVALYFGKRKSSFSQG